MSKIEKELKFEFEIKKKKREPKATQELLSELIKGVNNSLIETSLLSYVNARYDTNYVQIRKNLFDYRDKLITKLLDFNQITNDKAFHRDAANVLQTLSKKLFLFKNVKTEKVGIRAVDHIRKLKEAVMNSVDSLRLIVAALVKILNFFSTLRNADQKTAMAAITDLIKFFENDYIKANGEEDPEQFHKLLFRFWYGSFCALRSTVEKLEFPRDQIEFIFEAKSYQINLKQINVEEINIEQIYLEKTQSLFFTKKIKKDGKGMENLEVSEAQKITVSSLEKDFAEIRSKIGARIDSQTNVINDDNIDDHLIELLDFMTELEKAFLKLIEVVEAEIQNHIGIDAIDERLVAVKNLLADCSPQNLVFLGSSSDKLLEHAEVLANTTQEDLEEQKEEGHEENIIKLEQRYSNWNRFISIVKDFKERSDNFFKIMEITGKFFELVANQKFDVIDGELKELESIIKTKESDYNKDEDEKKDVQLSDFHSILVKFCKETLDLSNNRQVGLVN